MSNNNIRTLRNTLFATLERLSKADKENIELEVDKAVQIVKVSEAILATATVEAEIIKSVKTLSTNFIPDLIEETVQKQLEDKKEPYQFNSQS